MARARAAGSPPPLAVLAHERGEVELAFQLLSYPMLDDRTATRTDLDERQFRMWNNKANRFGWQSYTGHPPGSDKVSGLAAPARTGDLSGLPPTWIGVGTLDLFYEEDVAYATRLREAGVACELEEVPGAFHGFDSIQPKAGVTEAFRAAQVAALGAALGPQRVVRWPPTSSVCCGGYPVDPVTSGPGPAQPVE